jgi:hypothetical protein
MGRQKRPPGWIPAEDVLLVLGHPVAPPDDDGPLLLHRHDAGIPINDPNSVF